MVNPNQFNPIKSDHSQEASRVERTRPSREPKAKRDFRKVLDETERNEAELVADEVKEENPSLFDLASKRKTDMAKKSAAMNSAALQTDMTEEDAMMARKTRFEIPSGNPDPETMLADEQEQALLKSAVDPSIGQNKLSREHSTLLAAAAKQANLSRADLMAGVEDDSSKLTTKQKSNKSEDSKKSSINSEFVQEGSDMAGITNAQTIRVDTRYFEGKQEFAEKSHTEALIKQVVDQIRIIEERNLQKTIVDLKYPPILEGSTLTLTTAEAQSRQFSIAFSKLSPEAQAFLNSQKDTLIRTLEDQKFVINTFTTTQAPMPEIATQTDQDTRQFNRNDERGQQRNRERQG